MGASATAERFLNIELDCGLLMAIGDGMGELRGIATTPLSDRTEFNVSCGVEIFRVVFTKLRQVSVRIVDL